MNGNHFTSILKLFNLVVQKILICFSWTVLNSELGKKDAIIVYVMLRHCESLAIFSYWFFCGSLSIFYHVQVVQLCLGPTAPWTIAHQTPFSWNTLGKNTGVGSVQFSSVAQLCLTLCSPMNRSMPGLPVHHKIPEFTQTYVHQVGDAIQPSHPLLSPSPPAPYPSQYQGLFQWVNSFHEVAKVLEFQLQHQSFQWTPRTDLL